MRRDNKHVQYHLIEYLTQLQKTLWSFIVPWYQ